MLRAIAPSLNGIAHVISSVIGLDVEIVDTKLVRLAGTGKFASGVGKSIEGEGQIYKHALSSSETVYIDCPKKHSICRGCAHRNSCEEELTMCTPILVRGVPAGVIGIVCFCPQEKRRIEKRNENYLEFLQLMANMIAQSSLEKEEMESLSQTLGTLQTILEAYSDAVLLFGTDGTLSYINQQAQAELHLAPDERPKVSVTETGNSVGNIKELELRYNDTELLVMGRLIQLNKTAPALSQLVIFESHKNFTQKLTTVATPPHKQGLNAICGETVPILELKNRVRSIADSTSTVLLSGESGTGKELFARAIHQESSRRDQPFIAINCGAIPDTLLESELFGYTNGAFTGAHSGGRIGKFELAHGGVLFLDEISSMPLFLQVKLLRVLQERTITRLGSNKSIPVDLRIIAATNENLEEQIAANRFRSDLFYRLNVIPFDIPALRERIDDLELLLEHFLKKYCARFNKTVHKIDPVCLERLKAYSWPGNIRELENAVEFIINMMPASGIVDLKSLPRSLSSPSEQAKAIDNDILMLSDLERNAIQAALQRFGTSTQGKKIAAQRLGIGLATLYRKIQQYDF